MSGPGGGAGPLVVAPEPVDGADATALRAAYAREVSAVIGLHFLPGGDEDLAPPAGAFWVARRGSTARAADGAADGGEPVGCVGVRLLPGGDAEVKRLYAAPAARGLGAGAALLAAVEGWARAAGAPRLVLDTRSELVAAARLYRRCGYTGVARYNDNPHAQLWFAKPLA